MIHINVHNGILTRECISHNYVHCLEQYLFYSANVLDLSP